MPAAQRRYNHVCALANPEAVPDGPSATNSQLALGAVTVMAQSSMSSRTDSRLLSVEPTLVALNQALNDPAAPTMLLDCCTSVKLPPAPAPNRAWVTMLEPLTYTRPLTPPWSNRMCSLVLSNMAASVGRIAKGPGLPRVLIRVLPRVPVPCALVSLRML